MSTTPTADEAVDAPAKENPVIRILRTRQMLVSILLVVCGALALNVAHVRSHAELSPVDELQHIDYLYKAPAVVYSGEKVGQEAMEEQACRTLPAWPVPMPCSDDYTYDPDEFQEDGTNSAAIYTPFYYTVTKVVATPIQAVLGIDSLVTAARLVGGLWLAGGLVMLLLAARRLGAQPYPTAALALATASVPTVLYPSATITPDAAALLAGAALLWSVLWWQDSPRWRWWLPAVLSAGVVALKALNIIVVVLIALFVLLRAIVRAVQARRREGELDPDEQAPTIGQSLICIAAMSAVALIGAVGYILFVGQNAVASSEGVSMAERVRADVFPVAQTFDHIGVFLRVFYDAGSVNTLNVVGQMSQQLMGWFVFGGTFIAAFAAWRLRRDTQLLGVSLLVIGLIGAPMIIVFSYISQGMFVPIPGRYALTLIPAGVAVTAAAMKRPFARLACLILGFGCFLATLAFLVF